MSETLPLLTILALGGLLWLVVRLVQRIDRLLAHMDRIDALYAEVERLQQKGP